MLKKWLAISRPRFWLYLLGPFLIGAVAAGAQFHWWLAAFAVYFTYPANFVIYGVNDLFDYDTDKHNPKKQGYETLVTPELRDTVFLQAAFWVSVGVGMVLLAVPNNPPAMWSMLGFIFLGLFYSAPPLRAKTKPVLDSFFSILYVFPGTLGFALVAGVFPEWRLFAAAGLWCMAMHAYSAVPDIKADMTAGIRTIATWLGARGTLLFCAITYGLAAALSWPELGWFSIAAGAVYVGMMLFSLLDTKRARIFRLYKYFPYINMLVGMALFFWILFVL